MIETLLHNAWHGPWRRPVRSIFHRLNLSLPLIASGPLRGWQFAGPEAPCRLGIYELEMQRCLMERLRPGETVYDLGANNGFLSLLAAVCVGEEGLVCSFEPLPANAARIDKLMIINGISGTGRQQREVTPRQITVRMAVAERCGSSRFFVSAVAEAGVGASGYTPSLIRRGRTEEIEVETTTLDNFAATHRGPDLVKMDIEGAEVMALTGARRLLAERPPRTWLIEVHSAELDRGVREILGENGYTVTELPERWRRKEYPRHLLGELPGDLTSRVRGEAACR